MTKKEVTETLTAIHDQAKQKENHLYTGSTLTELGYTRQQWDAWRLQYEKDNNMMHQMDLIEQVHEARLMEQAYRGKTNVNLTSHILRHVTGETENNKEKAPASRDTYRPPYILLSGDRTMDI